MHGVATTPAVSRSAIAPPAGAESFGAFFGHIVRLCMYSIHRPSWHGVEDLAVNGRAWTLVAWDGIPNWRWGFGL